jgi:Flp pilus assembly protein TadB
VNVESIISVLGGIAIAILWVIPTSRVSFLVVGPLCIVAGLSMLYLRVGTWHAPVVLAFGIGGLAVYAWRRRKEGAKGAI